MKNMHKKILGVVTHEDVVATPAHMEKRKSSSMWKNPFDRAVHKPQGMKEKGYNLCFSKKLSTWRMYSLKSDRTIDITL